MRKTKANSPHLDPPSVAREPTLLSISPFSLRAVRIMKMTMLTTKDHEEDESEQPPFRPAVRCQGADFAFNLALQLAGGAHHENDHADNENGSHQHDPAFHLILIDGSVRKRDCACDAAYQSGYQSIIDGAAQVRTAYLGQVNQRDAHD